MKQLEKHHNRIIIAGADQNSLEDLHQTLRDHGYTVTVVRTMQALVDATLREHPELILSMDTNGMDALSTLQTFNGDQRLKSFAIFVIGRENGKATDFLKAGAVDYISSDGTTEELLIRIATRIRGVRKVADLITVQQRLMSTCNRLTKEKVHLRNFVTIDPDLQVWNKAYLDLEIPRHARLYRRHQGVYTILLVQFITRGQEGEAPESFTEITMLRLIADRFHRTCRSTDTWGYYGDGRFLVLAPQTDAGDAATFAKRLIEGISSVGEGVPIAYIAGVVHDPSEEPNYDTIVHEAKQLLSEIVQRGTDRVAIEGPRRVKS